MHPEKPATDPLEALQQQAGFVRRLAREFLRDADLADDVAQETALAAMHAGSTPRSVAAWTGGVVRNVAARLRRDRRRSSRREALVARPEAQPSTVDQLAREESLRSVTDAVLALPQPYRATVLARFFEDLPPREIAARDRVPVTTVKSRLRRGLALLRTELDGEHGGDRQAWALPLAGLAGLDPVALGLAAGGSASASAASTSTLTAMTWIAVVKTKTTALTFAALGILTILGAWALARSGYGEGSSEIPTRTPLAGTWNVADEAEPSARASSAAPTRREVSLAADVAPPERGSVVATLRWRDGSPVPAAKVRMSPWGAEQAFLAAQVSTTDEAGVVRFDDVAPGTVTVYGHRSGGARGTLEAGGVLHLDVTLEDGMTVHGTVIDDLGRPVPQASIVLAGGDDSLVVTYTDAAGRFELRGVTDQRELGARAPGYVPAAGVRVRGSDREQKQVDFVLGSRGSGLRLEIVDADHDRPLPHAKVRIDMGSFVDGGGPPGYTGTADEHGVFEARSVNPGTSEVQVAVAGYAPCKIEVPIAAGHTETLRIPLRIGATVAGMVRDQEGTPLEGVLVMHGSYGGLSSRSTRTDPAGRYRLTGLPLGTFALGATARNVGQASVELTGALGEVLEHDFVLDAGRVLKLRLADDRDRPLVGWMVNALGPEHPGKRRFRGQAISDAKGRVRIANCPADPLELQAMDRSRAIVFVHAQRSGVEAGTGEEFAWVIPRAEQPSAFVAGRVVGSYGDPAPARLLLGRLDPPDTDAPRARGNSHIETGDFRIGPLVPGRYEISAEREDEGLRSDPVRFTLTADEELRLDDLVLAPPGTLRPRFEIEGTLEGSPWVTVGTDGPLLIGKHGSRLDHWPEHGVPLPAGRYRILIAGGNALPSEHSVEITAGETATPTLRIETGTRIRYEARDGEMPEKLSLRATDGQGTALGGATKFPREWPMRDSFVVRRADAYAIEIESADGRRDAAQYVPGQPLVLTLR